MQRSTLGQNNSARYTFDGTRGQSIVDAGPKFRKRVLFLGAFLMCLTIANICMCSYYTYVSGACATISAGGIVKTCDYDATTDWQACFVQSNNSLGKMSTSFPTSMAFTGQQTLVYTWLAFAVLFKSLTQYELLQSTISFMLYAILGVVAYYAFNPYLPFPHQTAATVVSLTSYVRSDMYDGLPDNEGGERCKKAYNYNLAFLVIQYVSVGIVAVLLVVALKAEGIRRRYPLANQLPPLKRTTLPCILAGLTLLCYAVMIISKADASLISVAIFQNSINEMSKSVFPFAQGSVDIVTVFLIVSTMSVIRGTTRQSVSAFRLAALAGVIHVALVYPSIIGNFEILNFNKMWDMGVAVNEDPNSFIANFFPPPVNPGCKNFIYKYFFVYYNDATDLSHAPYVVPTDAQAAAWCKDTWVAVYAQVGMMVFMHLQVVACLVVYQSNKGRLTEGGEETGGEGGGKYYANNAAQQGAGGENNYAEPLLNAEKGVAFAQNVSFSNNKV